MSEVTLRIGGKPYKIACADGEEAHLARLGTMIDQKLTQMGATQATSEAQNLLFAGLFLADELHEAKDAIGDNPAELGSKMKALEESADAAGQKERETALELDAVRAERDALANDLANIKSAASGQEALFAGADFAPKLEQLADIIEKCADMLESKAADT